jgi:hypothetical protein
LRGAVLVQTDLALHCGWQEQLKGECPRRQGMCAGGEGDKFVITTFDSTAKAVSFTWRLPRCSSRRVRGGGRWTCSLASMIVEGHQEGGRGRGADRDRRERQLWEVEG